jgi:hypothetical protein
MIEIRNSILAGLAFGLFFGLFLTFRYNTNYSLIGGPIFGFFFGIAIYFFVTSKTVKRQTQIENPEGKSIIHSGGANHFLNGEAVGGKLYLFIDKLQFQSHNFNIQNHSQILEINEIKEVTFFNTLGLIPNGLSILTADGKTEKLVVNNRRLWKKEIEKRIINNK